MDNTTPCLSGSLDAQKHVHCYKVRVYHHDTDAQKILHHTHYLIFAERARSEFLRCLCDAYDLSFSTLPAFVVRQAEIFYNRPVGLDDLLTIKTEVINIGGSYLDLSQVFWHNALEICRVTLRLVSLHPTNPSPGKMPSSLVKAIETFSGKSQQVGRPPH